MVWGIWYLVATKEAILFWEAEPFGGLWFICLILLFEEKSVLLEQSHHLFAGNTIKCLINHLPSQDIDVKFQHWIWNNWYFPHTKSSISQFSILYFYHGSALKHVSPSGVFYPVKNWSGLYQILINGWFLYQSTRTAGSKIVLKSLVSFPYKGVYLSFFHSTLSKGYFDWMWWKSW